MLPIKNCRIKVYEKTIKAGTTTSKSEFLFEVAAFIEALVKDNSLTSIDDIRQRKSAGVLSDYFTDGKLMFDYKGQFSWKIGKYFIELTDYLGVSLDVPIKLSPYEYTPPVLKFAPHEMKIKAEK